MRLEVRSGPGRQAMQELGVAAVPAFVLFDSSRREVWRKVGGFPNSRRIEAEISRLGR